jgi:hypothetical protein
MKKTKSPKEKILGVKVRVLDDLIKEKKKSFAGFFFLLFFCLRQHKQLDKHRT